jgi:molybdopterin converting factor small subunit
LSEQTPITVELFGIPRRRAGRAEVRLPVGTVAETLRALEQTCPGLTGLIEDNRLSRHYLLSLDGRHFVSDLDLPLKPGAHLLLLSADAGG